MRLDSLASCAELTAEDAKQAARSSTSLRALLSWASEVARPGEGAPKVLMAIAHLAEAEWFEGSARIEIRGDDSKTSLSIFADHGMGIRERVIPIVRFSVGVDEFTRAVRLAPRLVVPLHATETAEGIVLSLPDATPDSEEPETIVIDEQSLHENERRTAPPPEEIHPTTRRPPAADRSGIHTRPTVRRMVAVRPEAFRNARDDRE